MSDTAKHLQELQEAEASLKAAFENYRTVALRANASLPSKPQPSSQPSQPSSEADDATPGPWEAHQQDRVLTGPYAEEYACWYITGYDGTDDGVCIASLDSGYTGAQTEANARLFAAARDLRAALRPFAALSTDDVVELGLEQAVLDARAAIASSEGRAEGRVVDTPAESASSDAPDDSAADDESTDETMQVHESFGKRWATYKRPDGSVSLMELPPKKEGK